MRLSVVIPCRNEVATIGAVLGDLARQTLDEPFEVVVADGCSNDGTRELLSRFPTGALPYRLRVVDNPSRTTPSGLNAATGAARGEYVIRVDAHARLPEDYLKTLLDAMRGPGRDVVGPATSYVPGAPTPVAAEIALALNTRMGTGGTPSRGGSGLREPARVIHTVMSCYRREVWEAVGGYDEGLLTNEDFDFDYRANLRGFGVWSLPGPLYLAVAQPTIHGLLRQRFRYGYWKRQVVKRHPRSLRARQLIPVVATAGIAASVASSFRAPALLAVPAAYGALLFFYALGLAKGEKGNPSPRRLAVIYAIIHLAWGAGFLWGMIKGTVMKPAARRDEVPESRVDAGAPGAHE